MDYTFICIIIDAPYTNSYEKRKLFTSQLFLGLQFLCCFGALQTKLKKYSTLKKLYVGSNRLFKKIHHFREPTLGTLGELLVGKLRILKVLESLYVGEAQTRFHPLPLPQSRTRSLILGIFQVTIAGERARMEEAKKRSGNTLRDLQHFSYHTESESSNFLAIS